MIAQLTPTFTSTSPLIAPEGEEDDHGSGRVSDRDFWSRLGWDFFCFPERYDLVQQHRDAGLDPRDEQHLSAAPLGSYSRPSTFTSRNGRTVSID